MIVIFSEEKDLSTNDVIDWLSHYDADFMRINHVDEEPFEQLELLREHLIGMNTTLHGAEGEATTFWHRRPDQRLMKYLRNDSLDLSALPGFDEQLSDNAKENLRGNFMSYQNKYFDFVLGSEERSIGDFYITTLNKLSVLSQASKLGIQVPDTLVTGEPKALNAFYQKHQGDIIAKTLHETVSNFGLGGDRFIFKELTKKVRLEETQATKRFFPTLFQQNIPKQFEIRTFFLKGEFYSSAMFTQGNERTSVDYRDYDDEAPARIVPYALPKDLEQKLNRLMEGLKLNCGSFDIIKGLDGGFYFLEVNPIGQFDFISKNCNYNLPKVIAEKLIHAHENAQA